MACSPAAVVVFLVDENERILLLDNVRRGKGWEVVSGALEAEETVLDAALRELHEELGSDVRVRPLGTVHASTWHYDDNAQYMISICYLMAYDGGPIVPGDDMAGSEYRWWTLAELEKASVAIPRERWLLERAVELYRLWNGQTVELQPVLP